MSAYLNALREEGTREDLLREVERQWGQATKLEEALRAAFIFTEDVQMTEDQRAVFVKMEAALARSAPTP